MCLDVDAKWLNWVDFEKNRSLLRSYLGNCLWIELFYSRDFSEFSIKKWVFHMPSNFTKLLFKSVFFHKLSNEFVQRDVLIHRLEGQGALGLRAHVAFKYITVSPGRTLPTTYQENWKCNLLSRAGGKKFSVILVFRHSILPILMPERDSHLVI